MKTNCLLVNSVLISLIAVGESVRVVFLAKVLLHFAGLLWRVGGKCATSLELYASIVSSMALVAHTTRWDRSIVLHVAIWLVKILLFVTSHHCDLGH